MSCAHIACAALAALVACSRPAERSGSQAAAPANHGDAMPPPQIPKTPEPPRSFTDGPPIEPPDQLLRWLETTASAEPRPRIRLPVAVRFRDSSRIGLDGGHIGVTPAVLPSAIQVALDDTAMGISLLDRVRAACPDAAQTACVVWLEGTWAGGPEHRFQVLALVGANPPGPPAGGPAIRALIEETATR